MSADNFDMPWRPTYEAYGAIGWGAATTAIGMASVYASIPASYSLYMGACSALAMVLRFKQAKAHWDFKVSLSGRKFYVRPMQEILEAENDTHMWLGRGWDWKPENTQRCYEALKRDIGNFLPPEWYLKLKKIPAMRDVVGAPWIHGLNSKEDDLLIDRNALEGHVLVTGTTGAGKTRLLESVVTQYIKFGVKSGDCTIILDPKGDKELADIARTACVAAGIGDKFIQFHPAFPASSIRFDPLKNWSRETQVASRIAMLMGGDSNDSFTQFAWRAINMVTDGLLYAGKRPTLKLIARSVAGGPDALMEQVLERFFEQNIPHWRSQLTSLIADVSKAKPGQFATKLSPGTKPELIAYVHYYKTMVPEHERNEQVNSLLELAEHPREHYSKVISNILPMLKMLTSGDVGDMLSPDAESFDDPRPIFDSGKIIEGGYVLYVGLDSLSDATVGTAMAGIILADLASKAGEIYNYDDAASIKSRRINLIMDEASELVCPPLVQLLNKGRGSGFVIWLLTQTFPDFIAKMGDEARARQILGNCNNLIALRTIDTPTQQFITERFGKTFIKQASTSYTGGSRSNDTGLAQTSGVSQSTSETEVDLIPPTILGRLPAMHYIGIVAGGRIIKGRLPKLSMDK